MTGSHLILSFSPFSSRSSAKSGILRMGKREGAAPGVKETLGAKKELDLLRLQNPWVSLIGAQVGLRI